MNRTLLSVVVAIAWIALLALLARNVSFARSGDAAMRLAKISFSALALVFLGFAVAVALSQRSTLFVRHLAGVVVSVRASNAPGTPVPLIAVRDRQGVAKTFEDRTFDPALYPGFASNRLPAAGDAVAVALENGGWKVVPNRKGVLIVLAILLGFASLAATIALMARHAIAP